MSSIKIIFLRSFGRRELKNFGWNITLGVTIIPGFVVVIL
jgi:hypothetical protein